MLAMVPCPGVRTLNGHRLLGESDGSLDTYDKIQTFDG